MEQLRDPLITEFKTNGAESFKHINVQILGDDILLPESDPNVAIDGDRTYSFTVVAIDPKSRSMRDLLASGDLRIEVIGARASLSFPTAAEGDTLNPPDPRKSAEPVISKGVARLTISLADNGKSLRPFTILAWFPHQFESGKDQESWFARKDVRVYFGDVRTRVQIVGNDEARAMFGTTFAENYFVGRVFLRNRSTSKSLAIYTTSMRVPVIFYRQSELEGVLTAAASEALTSLARERFDTLSQMSKPDTHAEAKEVVDAFLDKYPDPFLAPPREKESVRSKLSLDRTATENALLTRVLAEWARLSRDKKYAETIRGQLPQKQAAAAADWAFENYPDRASQPSDARFNDALAWAAGFVQREQLAGDRDRQTAHARDIVLEAWRLLDAEHERIAAVIAQTGRDLETLDDSLARLKKAPATGQPLPQPELYKRVVSAIRDQDVTQDSVRERIQKDIAKVASEEDRKTFSASLENAARLQLEQRLASDLNDSIEGANPAFTATKERLALLQSRALGVGAMKSPLDDRHQVMMGPTARNLAFSADTRLQRQMVEGGYLWRDAYRPMTFQAVLNSVMFAHDRDPRTMTVKVLETLAMVAGGAVGLSGVVDGLDSTGYLQSTNFFSSVLVPSLRNALVEDLRKHITNLGEMAMDTVVILPPNESMDRYVFFPRGAIYNFPDEFDATTPGYIAGIEGEELYVEAAQVNTDQILRGGTDSGALVSRALNEGERSEQSRLLQTAQSQSRLRNAELANLTVRIDSLMASVPAKAGPARDKALGAARSEINRMLGSFNAYFGADQSGALSAALVKHGLTSADSPPTVIPGRPVELLGGVPSLPLPVSVFDTETSLANLTFESNPAGKRPDWLAADPAFDSKSDPQTARLVLTPAKNGDTETVAHTFDFAVIDTSGNRATASQGVLVHAPAFAKTHTLKINGVSRQFAASATDVAFGKNRGVFEFTVPTFKSDGAQLKLVASAGKSIEGVDVVVGRSTFDAATARLSLSVTVDGSGSAGGTLPLNVYLVTAAVAADPSADPAAAALATLTCNVNLDSK